MSFDAKAFSRAKFEARTATVEVPELAEYNAGSPVPFVVRGLTGNELYHVKGAAERDGQVKALIDAVTGSGKEQVKAIRDAFGLSDELHAEHVKRLEMLIVAAVDPTVDRPMAVKLAAAYPVAFGRLTDKILELTGMGQVPGKQKGSGETRASATP